METRKWRVVCYVNQFFGQIGGEDMAHVGFSVKDKPVGPAVLFQNLLKNDCEVVGTIIFLLPDLPIMPDVMGLAAVIWQQRWEGNWGYPQ